MIATRIAIELFACRIRLLKQSRFCGGGHVLSRINGKRHRS